MSLDAWIAPTASAQVRLATVGHDTGPARSRSARAVRHRQEAVPLVREEGPSGFDVHAAYTAHGGEVLGYVLNGIGDRAAAEDCVQEIFVKAWRSRARYDAERASARTWLFAIARNVVIDHHRARHRRPRPVDDAQVQRAATPQPDETSDVERRMLIYDALGGLSAEHREVVVAVQLEGLDYLQLSQRCGVPVNTLRTRMFYALRALRAILGEEERHG